MSLTYQPFAAMPEINALEVELKHNVNDMERYGSIAAGAGILIGSFWGHGLARLLLLGTAGALVYRGITGHCHLYERLGVSTRPPGPGERSPENANTASGQAPLSVAA